MGTWFTIDYRAWGLTIQWGLEALLFHTHTYGKSITFVLLQRHTHTQHTHTHTKGFHCC